MKLPLLLAALLAGVCQPVSAQPYGSPAPPAKPLTCVVCAKPIVGNFFVHKTNSKTNNLCAECERIELRCTVCGLPAREGYGKTPDGRVICSRDLPNVVMTEAEGVRLFAQTRSELGALGEGALTLRNADVLVKMFDVDYWNAKGDASAGLHKLGFSSSRNGGAGTLIHNVLLLSGQSRDQTMSVCAHEFGHLWLNENLPAGRQLEANSREALCELLAHKLAQGRKDTNEMTRLKNNAYTKGVILDALEFEARAGMPGVVAWVRTGKDAALPAATGEKIASTATGTAPTSPPPAAPAVAIELRPTPPPATKLELRSLLRTSRRTVAVINGERFEAGSELSMLIDGKRHNVRMVSVEENGVVVTVDGAKQTLRLGAK